MIGPVSGRINTINNAAYSWMNSANALISMTGNAANQNPASLLSNEKNLRMTMLNDSLMYKANELQEEVAQKLKKDNIKRSFSTFA